MVQINFNATAYDPSTGSQDVFEPGEYSFQIVKSETKATKSGGGTMLVFECACLDDGFSGKRLTIRLNIVNQNPQAVEIAFRDLSAISHVCGVLAWQDTQQLHGRPFRVRLDKNLRTDIQQDPNNLKYNNEVRAYLDMNGQIPVKGQVGGAGGAGGAPVAPPQQPVQPVQPAALQPSQPAQQFAPPQTAPQAAPAPAPQTVAPPFAQQPAQQQVAPPIAPPFAQPPVTQQPQIAPPFAQPAASAPQPWATPPG